jgi:Zn-dependent protease
MSGAASMILAMLTGWLAHELGHALALRLLGRGAAKQAWACYGREEVFAAAAGPFMNLLLLGLARLVGWQSGFEANFVLAVVNMLPFLPLDGGKVLRGLLGGVFGWERLSRFLLLLGQAAALAFCGVVYYFNLPRVQLLLAVWLYVLAWREERNLAVVAGVRRALSYNKEAK